MIEIEHVGKRFGDVIAVDDVTFSVAKGELLVLLGGSGSGKSTLLRMVNRLIEPSSGRIRVGGREVTSIPAPALRRTIGYCFQRIGLFPHLTIAANVGVTPELLGWRRERIEARIDEVLRLVELEPARFRDRFAHELSGGEQQRVGVARALAAAPSVILLDEPFGALDPLTRESVQRAFDRLRRELSLTAVFVTHDVLEAFLLADRIAVVDRGHLLQIGAPHDLLAAPADSIVERMLDAPRRQAREVERVLRGHAEKPA